MLALCWIFSACGGSYDDRLIAEELNAGGSGGNSSGNSCGDGRITGLEKCDTGIDFGQPGACPTFCPASTDCIASTLTGSDCMQECSVTAKGCAADDGVCCPCELGASAGTEDSDCSGSCGDGVVQPGEKCEPDPTIPSITPCPVTLADCDQSNPCRTVTIEGSAEQCSAACVYTAITAPLDGDMCCPPGATPALDSDCNADCGNGTVEPGEDCDGDANCTNCELMLRPEQRICFDRITDEGSPASGCERCACTDCPAPTNGCRDTANPAHEVLCNALFNCGLTKNCVGVGCYCIADCVFVPDGPCVPEVEAAAESKIPTTILARMTNPDFALKYAVDISSCMKSECPETCPH